jgi:serine/threonine protein kinase/Flp pilus assembly protein TadD
MTPERWQQIKEIFNSALQHEPGERYVFLSSACGEDESLRKELESLIASYEKEGSFIDSPAYQAAAELIVNEKAELKPGQVIGSYEIISFISRGGMGEVYLAQDKRLGRRVALKLLPATVTKDVNRLRRFEQEARAASALNHPNILTIHEIHEADSTLMIATEYVEGETLRQRLRYDTLDLQTALHIAIQIADALAAAHQASIIHRDIKPENIMIRPDGYVKVLDFGLAKLTEHASPMSAAEATTKRVKTGSGMIIGTVGYMSPEQARGQTVDARSDIFNLGAVIYEMVAGQKPFDGETPSDVLAAILKSEPPVLSHFTPEAPPELVRIVTKALRKDREQRYQVIKDMLLDLKSLKEEMEFQAKLDRSIAPSESNEGVAPGSQPQRLITETDAEEVSTKTREIAGKPTLPQNQKARRTWLLITLLSLLIAAVGFFAYRSFIQNDSEQIESIAVLPFVNESGNAEVEYLSDGMTESLINSLSQLPHLSVKARSTVFHYKGKEAEPQRIATELSVQAILSGRVVQRGNDLTLYLSLVDGRNGNQIWGEQYNRKLTDLLALQTEIAHDVSKKLRLRLTSTEQQRLARQGTENAEAYRAYLRGIFYWNKGLAPGFEKSREYFQRAIDLDPTYARAYAGLADYYGFATIGLLPPNEAWPKAEAAANKALALDDTLAETYNALAAVKLYYHRDWPSAERYFRRGIELDPNSAEIRAHYALCLMSFGRNEEALAEAQRSVELDPLSPRFNYFWGRILFFMRQYDRAIDQFRKTLELDPNYVTAHEDLGDAYAQKGMQREAVAEWGKALTLRGAGEQASILERTYAASGFEATVRALAQEQLAKLNERMRRGEYVPAHEYVTAYTRLGDKEQAFAWLDKAVQETYGFAGVVKVNPIYDKLRSDPRFQESLRKVGF